MTGRCETCRWWHEGLSELATAAAAPAPTAKARVGSCQVAPPTMVASVHFPVSLWPISHADRGCGSWTPRAEQNAGNVVPIGSAA